MNILKATKLYTLKERTVWYLSKAVTKKENEKEEEAWIAPPSPAGYSLKGRNCRPILVRAAERGEEWVGLRGLL